MWFDDPNREMTQKEIEAAANSKEWFWQGIHWLFGIFVFIPFVIYWFTR